MRETSTEAKFTFEISFNGTPERLGENAATALKNGARGDRFEYYGVRLYKINRFAPPQIIWTTPDRRCA